MSRLYRCTIRCTTAWLLGLTLLLTGQVGSAYSYYDAGPTGTIGVSRPTISQQFMLAAGERIDLAQLSIDGGAVRPTVTGGLVSYTPPTPLAAGSHHIQLSATVKGPSYAYSPLIQAFTLVVDPGAVQTLPGATPEQYRALERVNGYRKAVGLSLLAYSNELGAASSRHAQYLITNPAQRQANPHDETPGTILFFGKTGGDRARYFGYRGGTDEVIHFTDRAEDAVDGWMDTLYHRIGLIHPGMKEMGYGVAGDGQELVDVILAGPIDDTAGTVLWPYAGQTGVPTGWDGWESPDPFAAYPGATHPVGYTVTLTFGAAPKAITLQTGTLTGPGGAVPVYTYQPVQDTHLTDTVALIPQAPLQPSTTYTAHMAGTVDMGAGPVPYDRTWSFTTRADHHPTLQSSSVSLEPGGVVRTVTIDGDGLQAGSRGYLGGLPVEGLTIVSDRRLTFSLPAGFKGGSADFLLVNPVGWEVAWRKFFTGAEGYSYLDYRAAFTPRSLMVHGKTFAQSAMVHVGGAVLVPDQALVELGAQRTIIDAINRSYWTLRGRNGDFLVGRTASDVAGQASSLGLPVQKINGTTYVDLSFLRQLSPDLISIVPNSVSLGLSDMTKHWSRGDVTRLFGMGIVSGRGDGQYGPESHLNRAEFVKMLVVARGLTLRPGETGGIADVASHWVGQMGYMGAAVRAGIILPAEYAGGRFEPERDITREEIGVMVTRALGLESQANSRVVAISGGKATVAGRTFTDATSWGRRGHIATAVEQGIIVGVPEEGGVFTYRPQALAVRGEAAAMVVRSLGK